jgi:hypothetical protein
MGCPRGRPVLFENSENAVEKLRERAPGLNFLWDIHYLAFNKHPCPATYAKRDYRVEGLRPTNRTCSASCPLAQITDFRHKFRAINGRGFTGEFSDLVGGSGRGEWVNWAMSFGFKHFFHKVDFGGTMNPRNIRIYISNRFHPDQLCPSIASSPAGDRFSALSAMVPMPIALRCCRLGQIACMWFYWLLPYCWA